MGLNYIKSLTAMITKHKFLIGSATVLFALAIAMTALIRANAATDTTPMELVDLQVSATSIDTSSGEVEVDITGEVFEDLSGFGTIEFFYLSPSGGQIIEGDSNSDPELIEEFILFPQYSEPGVWRPTFTLVDEATNSVTLGPDDLANLGFNVDITITSSPADTSAPTVSNIVIQTPSVDTSTSLGTVPVSVFASDNLVGIDTSRSQISFISPSGNQRTGASFTHVSGNEYLANVPVNQYAEVGTWDAELTLTDSITNTQLYDASDLALLSLPNSVNVTGNGDTTFLSVDALDFSVADPVLTGGSGSAEVTIVGEFSDNLSGYGSTTLTYRSQSSTQAVETGAFFDGTTYQFNVIFPFFASTGVWLPELATSDLAGNMETLSHTDLVGLGYDLTIDIKANESGTVASGGSVTTDIDGDGATPAAPFEAEVVTPVAGEISITQVALTEPVSANDFLVYDQQYDITAPTASAESPLVLTFTIDSGSLAGQTASTVQVFRNGEIVEDCLGSSIADPDPCVTQRNTLGDGDVELVVNTSEASIWVLGYATPTEPTYTFKRFKKPVKNPPEINKVEPKQSIPVKFKLNGESSRLDVLEPHVASSQRINCSTLSPIGNPSPINLTKNGDLKIKPNGVYKFKWKTLKKWENKCRQLILEFDNGETVYAYFKFEY